MKGVRFYFDFGSATAKRRGGDAPNALAVFPDNVCPDGSREAIAALTDEPNAPVCGTSVSLDYLRRACKRVAETEAYRVHPALRERMTGKSKMTSQRKKTNPACGRYPFRVNVVMTAEVGHAVRQLATRDEDTVAAMLRRLVKVGLDFYDATCSAHGLPVRMCATCTVARGEKRGG